jgi:hypothetical protein
MKISAWQRKVESSGTAVNIQLNIYSINLELPAFIIERWKFRCGRPHGEYFESVVKNLHNAVRLPKLF